MFTPNPRAFVRVTAALLTCAVLLPTLSARAETLAAQPEQFAPAASKNPVKKSGKYAVELRLPEGGLYAEEAIDIEFRLTDTSNNDPILGAAGVIQAKTAAKVTMPAMPGMPAQAPKIHREGVPGDYGIECFFPHGGEYQIDLTLTPPGEPKPFTVSFKVDVKDADAVKNRKPRPKPFTVEIVNRPSAKAGEPTPLRLAIRDTKTKEIVKDFDIAHEQRFHLILVSKDLGWFAHVHPEQQSDGAFTIDQTFPAGGEYRLFADVAPRGAGSQVLPTTLKVSGGSPTWDTALKPTPMTAEESGVKATLVPQERLLPVGKSTLLTFKVTDPTTDKPITDLEPYLGALGHLILIHQDGQTFVHSHPMEDEGGIAASRAGNVTFNARFPKPGRYKAWAQFQRSGKVLTLAYVLDVKGALR
jgi:hypothetical protein